MVYLKDLKDECFVTTAHADRGGLSYLVANLCLAAGFTSQKAPILSRKVSQLQLVAANLGISIVPEEFKQILPNQVKLLPLADDLSFSEVFLVYRKDQDEMIQHCAEQIHQMFQS